MAKFVKVQDAGLKTVLTRAHTLKLNITKTSRNYMIQQAIQINAEKPWYWDQPRQLVAGKTDDTCM